MILDIAVLGILIISAIVAFLRGFLRELLTIMGVIGGAIAARALGPVLQPVMEGWLRDPAAADGKEQKLFDHIPLDMAAMVLSYGAIFIVVVIALSIVSHFLSGWAKAVGLGAVDRSFGVFFGLARGALLISLLYLPVLLIWGKEERADWKWTADSKTYSYVESGASWLAQFIPEEATADVKQAANLNKEKAAEARERLQTLEMLQQALPQGVNADGTPVYSSATQASPDQGGGYEQEQRRDMNELIMDNTNE